MSRAAQPFNLGAGKSGQYNLQLECIGFGSLPGMILSLDTIPRKSFGTKDDDLVQVPEQA